MKIRVGLTKTPKAKPAPGQKLGFGRIFSDHMFVMNYKTGKGWYDPRIVPYGELSLSPAAMCLHYGQTVFEGMKAYYGEKGEIRLFRPDQNFARLNNSNRRLTIPHIDEELCLEGLKKLIQVDKDWVPHDQGSSLYIRPFIIATDPMLGVRPGDEYLFLIITSPSGAYYESGLAPVKIYVESNYVRAVRGGTGMAKTGGNYAASLIAQDEAHKQNYSQVLWLDGVEQRYIEEVGAMNVFFVLDGEVVTPELHGSILPGITRSSSIQLLRDWGLNVSERRISIEELDKANDEGRVLEAFGTGTAAVISPIGELRWGEKKMIFHGGSIGQLTQRLYDTLTGIQYGRLPDPHGWSVVVTE
ncbi:MAG: branched-chain amino acid aminotransferase [Angelakisella sp.]|jgi:branched-chain amino acid aminotransferase|nr:branched-chain amino acid aminotransferase [Angelakisella sp.]